MDQTSFTVDIAVKMKFATMIAVDMAETLRTAVDPPVAVPALAVQAVSLVLAVDRAVTITRAKRGGRRRLASRMVAATMTTVSSLATESRARHGEQSCQKYQRNLHLGPCSRS
jgi:hypothetical protein